jgi:hypothetical protein
MKNKTMSLFNVPLPIARRACENTRFYIAERIGMGAPLDEIITMIYALQSNEEELLKREYEPEEEEAQEDEEND